MSTTVSRVTHADPAWPHIGWPAVTAATWSLAGGAAGGLLTAALVLTGNIHVDAVPIAILFFAAGGSTLGTVHGSVLGFIGRPAGTLHDTSDPAFAGPLAVAIAFAAALVLAILLGFGAIVARAGRAIGWVSLLFALPAALGAIAAATFVGWHALENAYARWPDHRVGSLLVLGAFGVLVLGALVVRPAIPGTQLQLPALGYVLFAALATLWVAAPAVVIGLRMLHRRL